jgi:3-oxoacyl-[acyl-carrier-protein] synthase I
MNTFEKCPLILTDLGIACSLGVGKQEISQVLFTAGTPKITTTTAALFSGKKINIFLVSNKLKDLPVEYASFNSRNNRLLKLVLDQIIITVNKLKLRYGASRIGVVLATTSSGTIEAEISFKEKRKTENLSINFSYDQQEIASPSMFAAKYLAVEGPAYTISTACTSSSKAMISARRLILAGICDAVVCGGVDTLSDTVLNGFDSLELLTEQKCFPFSINRNGTSLGEGSAVFVLTKQTTENISNSIIFYGGSENSDAYHISAPDPSGIMPEHAILSAINMAGFCPKEISYINLHGTGTRLNDEMESKCINRIFGELTPCSSTKSLTGHTLGAAGAIEAGMLWLALANNHSNGSIPLPPHIWDMVQDPNLPVMNFVKPGQRVYAQKCGFVLISNSFAFGGSNACIVLGKQLC